MSKTRNVVCWERGRLPLTGTPVTPCLWNLQNRPRPLTAAADKQRDHPIMLDLLGEGQGCPQIPGFMSGGATIAQTYHNQA